MTTAVDGVISGLSDAGVVSQPLRRTSRQAEMLDRNNITPALFIGIKITQSEIECQTGMGYIYYFEAAECSVFSQRMIMVSGAVR